jgi:Ca2+-binding RTX toxin-like protein
MNQFDTLERRRLLSTVQLNGSTLEITGTTGNDFIDVSFDETALQIKVVTSGDPDQSFDPDDVDFISVHALGGDDYVSILVVGVVVPSTVSGGDGNDVLLGGVGNDSMSGNAGRDTLLGSVGNDRLAGNGGRDRIAADSGNDVVFGGAGGDWIFATNDNDVIKGEGGDDIISSSLGVTTISGGDGDDTVYADDGFVDSIFGDAGTDSARSDGDDILASIETTLPA